jgi:hypothetical protein
MAEGREEGVGVYGVHCYRCLVHPWGSCEQIQCAWKPWLWLRLALWYWIFCWVLHSTFAGRLGCAQMCCHVKVMVRDYGTCGVPQAVCKQVPWCAARAMLRHAVVWCAGGPGGDVCVIFCSQLCCYVTCNVMVGDCGACMHATQFEVCCCAVLCHAVLCCAVLCRLTRRWT